VMMKFEGWKHDPPTMSFRHNNPGNLRKSKYQAGVKNGYAFFADYWTGLYALLFDLACKCMGKTTTGLGPDSTLADLIEVWAPASDGNNPAAYALFVAGETCHSVSTRLSWFLESSDA